MAKIFSAGSFFICYFLLKFCFGDPGRDLCKIVSPKGLKCSKIFSYSFPYDTFLSFNDDLAHFTNEMKYLEIQNSNISVLQARSFQRTPFLSHIILSSVFLVEIEPGAFEGLKSLKLVDLSYNLLQNIPADAFKYTKLSRLNLEGNTLLEIPSNDPVLHAQFLTSLSLKNCNIQHLPAAAFQLTKALIHLDLSKNYLKMLPQEIFGYLKNLAFLDLSENQFQSLDIKIIESMPSFPKFPTTVILSDNPWVCDCKISKLGQWITTNEKTGGWCEKPELCRMKKSVECQKPERISWNSVEFQKLIASC